MLKHCLGSVRLHFYNFWKPNAASLNIAYWVFLWALNCVIKSNTGLYVASHKINSKK